MKFQRIVLMLILSITTAAVNAQKRVNRFPVGTFHQKNQNINGISAGFYSGFAGDSSKNVHTNGLRLEVPGMGILSPLIPQSPIAEDEAQFKIIKAKPVAEHINGLNLSPAGTACDCATNGISAGVIGQITRQVNGVSVMAIVNFSQQHNGLQAAMFNESYAMNGLQIGISNSGARARGLQIGLFNHSRNFKGMQIGLWNVNQKRKLPIINWNF